MIASAIAVAALVAGYLLSRARIRHLEGERARLEADLRAYSEAHNRSPYPVDVDAILSEWRP